MIHTIIFDIGGTLVKADSVFHSFADHLDQSRREELFQFMRPIFIETYRDETREEFWTIKQIASYVLKRTSEHFGLPDISARVPEMYEDCYLGHATLFGDVIPVMKRLREMDIKIIAVSDADADVLDKEMLTFDLKKYFDKVIVSSNVEAYKPSDKMVDHIRNQVERPYNRILFVGDTEPDILAAKKLTAHSVLIRRNGKYPIPADYRISDLNEIFGIISSLENE